MMTTSLDSRLARARELHADGYNCAQCVAMVFDDLQGVDGPTVAKAAAAFGGGFGGQRQLCGAVSGMGLIVGMTSDGDPARKQLIYAQAGELARRYREINGSMVCGELLRSRRKSCMALIEDAITIIDSSLNK